MNLSPKEGGSSSRVARAVIVLGAVALISFGASSLSASAATRGAKSRGADIASDATRVVVQVDRGLNAKSDRHSTYATTNAAIITAVIARVNALPKPPASGEMCPMDVGAKLTLSFYRHATHPYAVVLADPGGCGPVSIRNQGTNDTLKGSTTAGGGVAFSTYVAKRLHIKTVQVP